MHETDVLVESGRRELPKPLVSVIIPALNEAELLESTLCRVASQTYPHEIIVVDGGSTDRTPILAAEHAHVIASPQGRAAQMNRGAAAARGDILLFLHADTLLPPEACEHIRRAVDAGAEAGAFRLSFDAATPLLRFYSFCTRFPLPRLCFGDRALFVLRHVFEEIGGYPDFPLFEDLEIVQILSRRGRFRFLRPAVTTSARRFRANGALRQQLRNSYLWLHYVGGRDPEKLKHLYRYD